MGDEDKTQRDLGRLEGALEGVRDALKALVARFDKLEAGFDGKIAIVDKKADDAHARISRVEKRVAYYVGIGSAIVFILTNAPVWLGLVK